MDPKETNRLAELEKENKALRQTISEYETAAKQAVADEGEIRDRMQGGLSREQAIQVINDQRQHDARLGLTAKAKK